MNRSGRLLPPIVSMERRGKLAMLHIFRRNEGDQESPPAVGIEGIRDHNWLVHRRQTSTHCIIQLHTMSLATTETCSVFVNSEQLGGPFVICCRTLRCHIRHVNAHYHFRWRFTADKNIILHKGLQVWTPVQENYLYLYNYVCIRVTTGQEKAEKSGKLI